MNQESGSRHRAAGIGQQALAGSETAVLTAPCCIACGRPVPTELIAAGVVRPATLHRRSLDAAHNELATAVTAAEDVIDPCSAPPQSGWSKGSGAGPHSGSSAVESPASTYDPAGQDGPSTRGASLNGNGGLPIPVPEKSVQEGLIEAAAEAVERARGATREDASDSENPPLAVLGQGEYARTIPATSPDAGWFGRYVAAGRA